MCDVTCNEDSDVVARFVWALKLRRVKRAHMVLSEALTTAGDGGGGGVTDVQRDALRQAIIALPAQELAYLTPAARTILIDMLRALESPLHAAALTHACLKMDPAATPRAWADAAEELSLHSCHGSALECLCAALSRIAGHSSADASTERRRLYSLKAEVLRRLGGLREDAHRSLPRLGAESAAAARELTATRVNAAKLLSEMP